MSLPANISHQAHAISRPYQTWSNIQRLHIWEFLERVQLLAIHGMTQAMPEGGGGYLVGIVGYSLLMLDASASIGEYLDWYCEESMRLPSQPFLWSQ